MDPKHTDRLDEIYRQARALPGPQVSRYLDDTCAGNPELRAAVEALLEQTRTSVREDLSEVEPAESIPAGTILASRFRVQRFLGRGGMGEVYLAADMELGGDVALKTLKPSLLADSRFLLRFRREVHLGRQVTHPNLCRIFDVGSDHWRGHPVTFFSMEFLPGETLSQYLRREGAMPVETALPLLQQIASAIDALHERGIAHRDLKPGNVMLVPGRDGRLRAVITDFGLARSFELEPGEEAVSREGQVIGTPQYMAPEQRMGEPGTAASDIYSLGLIVFEMVTGRRAADVATALGRPGRIPPPITILPALPVNWNAAILQCLALEPQDRPRSATAAVEALSEAGAPTVVVTAGDPELGQRPTGRGRVVLALGVLALFAIGATAVWLNPGGNPIGSGQTLIATSESQYLQARDLLAHFYRPNSVQNAITILSGVVEKDPPFALGHAGLGLAHWYAYRVGERRPEDLQKAIDASQHALRLQPNLVRAHVTLGSIYTMTGKTDLAAAALDRARALEPRSPEIYQALAELYRAMGRDADVEPMLQQAADLAPDDWRTLTALGAHLKDAGKLDEAERWFRRTVEVSPDNPIALSNLGLCYLQQNRVGEARKTFTRALELEPRPGVYSNLGICLMREGKFAEAIPPFEKAVEANPGNYLYQANLAAAFGWSKRDPVKSTKHYQRAVELAEAERTKDPRNPRLLSDLAAYYAVLGNEARSTALIRQALALSPGNASITFRAAETYEILKKRDQALRLVKEALALGYPMAVIQNSPELSGLRSDARFSFPPRPGLR